MYIEREIEQTIDSMLGQGKVVLVTGARQVGKTTVLKQHLGDRFDYVSMENPRDYLLAKEDAALFFESHDTAIGFFNICMGKSLVESENSLVL